MTEPPVGEETVDADDLLDDPRTDIEALCLGALLWSPAPAAQRVTDMLDPTDFNRPFYAELFTVITGQVTAGVPHDPASIAAALTRAGTSAGHHGALLRHALTQATLSGAPAETVEHYARTVISAAYRRSYHVAAASLAQAAAELPEDQLFEHLLSIGRAQRAASHRLADPRR
jgi:replicative DNA helicase